MINWSYYFIIVGAISALFTLGIGYVLSLTMQFMQDKPKPQTFKIHSTNTSRFGGIGIFIAFIIIVMAALEIACPFRLYNKETVLIDIFAGVHLYIASAIILASGLIKDMNRSANTLLMIMLQIVGIVYFIMSFGFLTPNNSTASNMLIIVYCIFILTNIHAINIIDGINGNAGFTCLILFVSLCFVACKLEANFLIFASSLMVGILIVFLCFNYPYGKIFLGDSGSFLLGFIIGALVIIGIKYYRLDVLYILSLLIYPCCEIVTSIWTRWKMITNYSLYELLLHICEPNNYHLHFFLYARFGNRAAAILAVTYCFFAILSSLYYDKKAVLIANIFIFCILYSIAFLIFRTKNKYLYIKT
ncbi:hypothetical protein CQA66_04695 [Helicobacter aurati]|uniref:Undecaprenyl/decaprenyl-phosphate alpha-N-acetylglucosaminyl 1-phosphate transferase n=1 Tax=Helicobacter aurati TaxID=137778 RepID=A0A3D8J6T3_9HELI|nr:hypothetical protein [Helicobacter aurati]RDU72604.1 hypothetical protein CQA66_04695 [Helicobacter aurati]